MDKITVKAARVNVGLTQKEMAEKLGMSGTYYSVLEQHPGGFSLEVARKIAEIVDQPLDRLFFYEKN